MKEIYFLCIIITLDNQDIKLFLLTVDYQLKVILLISKEQHMSMDLMDYNLITKKNLHLNSELFLHQTIKLSSFMICYHQKLNFTDAGLLLVYLGQRQDAM